MKAFSGSPNRRRLALIALGCAVAAGAQACAISFGDYRLDDRDGGVTSGAGGGGVAGAAGSATGGGAQGGDAGAGQGGTVAAGGYGGGGQGGSGVGGQGGAAGAVAGTGGTGGRDGGATGGVAGMGGASGGSGGKAGTAGAGGSMPDAGPGGSGGGGSKGFPLLSGPTMVELPIPAGAPGAPGTYCIDHTEVTNQQYAAFLATNPDINAQPGFCKSWNTSFQPETLAGSDNCPSVTAVYDIQNKPQNPVACIDWCDAYAYCASVGKRLCGAFGGGAVAAGSGADAKKDEWYAACSAGGTLTYPYGNTFQPQACNTLDFGATGSVRVGLASACTGSATPYDFLYDMSGNVAEWEDACAGAAGASDVCYARGGFWNSYNPSPPSGTMTSAACNVAPSALGTVSGVSLTRSRRSAEIGFRCCYDGK